VVTFPHHVDRAYGRVSQLLYIFALFKSYMMILSYRSRRDVMLTYSRDQLCSFNHNDKPLVTFGRRFSLTGSGSQGGFADGLATLK